LPHDPGQQADEEPARGSTAGPIPAASAAGPGAVGQLLSQPQVLVAVIGQTAAIFAAAAAVVYSAGALSLAFKLWYDGAPVEPVLVQLPRSLPLSQAVTEVLPAAIATGLLAIFLWKRINRSALGRAIAGPTIPGPTIPGPTIPGAAIPGAGQRGRGAWRWLISVVLALFFTGITLLFASFLWISPIPGIFPRPLPDTFIICLILDTVAIRLALHFLPKLPRFRRKALQDTMRLAILTLALIPIVASTSAAYAFPIVKLCGPDFTSLGTQGRHYAIGNLIGVSGQWVYVAEILTKEPRPHHFEFAAGYIAAIPLSEVRLEAIGRNASCGEMVPRVLGG
jgi:hypothetical protein